MLTPVKILVVEDDQVDVMAFRRALDKRGLTNPVQVAGNGREALDLLRSRRVSRPYVILLDMNMPRMNGTEFLAELRRDEVHRDAVVFVLTTSSAAEDRREAYSANVAGYIEKSNVGKGFANLFDLLERYWQLVTLP